MKKNPLYAQVVFPLPVERCFDYVVPESFRGKAFIGTRVRAPFGKSSKVGYIVGLASKSKLPAKVLKPLSGLLEETPLLDEKHLQLSRELQAEYLCSQGEALEAIFPTSLRVRKRPSPRTEEEVISCETEVSISGPQKILSETVLQSLREEKPKHFLLLGEPGSDKTAFILHLVQQFLERGLSSIVLYPEIALARSASERFRRRFGEQVCFFHSQMSPLDRYEVWKSLKEGKHRVVVGVRSAIFSPVQQLGLIVLCDEHDTSYKQDETPRYHARRAAFMRSALEKATVILESETPSLESFTQALNGRYAFLRLPASEKKGVAPKVNIIDMQEESLHQKRKILFSKYLERRITGVLQEKGQVLLFLNRRGFSTFVHCRKCGTVLRCAACRVPLKYHSEPKRLICHYCNLQEDPPSICPNCRENYLTYAGVGTERLESEAHRIFPGARIVRLDTDTLRHEGPRGQAAEAFRRKEKDILIGTQMVARENLPEG
ncbi:MAG: primosomal protein N', partial [Candidatus Omnitrophota bacterium]